MEQTRNRKMARRSGASSAWKRNVMAASVAAVLACVGSPAYAQKVELGANTSTGPDGTAIGARATTSGDGGTALGLEAKALADRATAVGRRAEARAVDSLALGAGAIVDATAVGSIALGAGSHATGLLTMPAYLGAPADVVPTAELAIGGRRITGLAAGANDYDAVNVLQLKRANLDNEIAVKYDWADTNGNGIADELDRKKVTLGGVGGTTIGNVAAGVDPKDAVNVAQLKDSSWTVTDAAGNKAKIGQDDLVTFRSTDSNLKVEQSGVDDAAVVDFTLSKNLDLGAAGSVTMGGTEVNTTGLTIIGGPSVTTAGINAGAERITNVAVGAITDTSTDAVNGSPTSPLAPSPTQVPMQ